MEKTIITNNTGETRKIGAMLAEELKGGEIICLAGDLGAGKTTFTQGLLKGLGAEGPFTSPTFLVMKEYKLLHSTSSQSSPWIRRGGIRDVFHIDAYRVGVKDILNLGWEEVIADKNNIAIIEWAERIKGILPKDTQWITFSHARTVTERIITFA